MSVKGVRFTGLGKSHSSLSWRPRNASSSLKQAELSGTSCARPAFMRVAGMVHSAPLIVTSSHRASLASPGSARGQDRPSKAAAAYACTLR